MLCVYHQHFTFSLVLWTKLYSHWIWLCKNCIKCLILLMNTLQSFEINLQLLFLRLELEARDIVLVHWVKTLAQFSCLEWTISVLNFSCSSIWLRVWCWYSSWTYSSWIDLRKWNFLFYEGIYGNGRGIGFYLGYQCIWDMEMISKFRTVSKEFITLLKIARWRTARCHLCNNNVDFWRVPMRMPNCMHFWYMLYNL